MRKTCFSFFYFSQVIDLNIFKTPVTKFSTNFLSVYYNVCGVGFESLHEFKLISRNYFSLHEFSHEMFITFGSIVQYFLVLLSYVYRFYTLKKGFLLCEPLALSLTSIRFCWKLFSCCTTYHYSKKLFLFGIFILICPSTIISILVCWLLHNVFSLI